MANSLNKKDLISVIEKSAEDLHRKIDIHRDLMSTILEQRVDDDTVKRLLISSFSSNGSRLKEALKETIAVLEETRKAFKSKRLEVLRKKLTRILIEAE
jgi:hypothetical protein